MGLLVAETVGAVMHGNEDLRFQFVKSLHGLLGTDVMVAEGGRFVGTDRQDGNFGSAAGPNFFEPIEVGGIAAVIDGTVSVSDEVASIASVRVGNFAGTPMFGGCESDLGLAEGEGFPPIHFLDPFETEIVNKVADAAWDDDGLAGGYFAQAAAVKVIEMGVGDEDEIDIWEVIKRNAGMFLAPDDPEPIGPIRIDQNIESRGLNKKRGVPDPGQAELVGFEFRKNGADRGFGATFFSEE